MTTNVPDRTAGPLRDLEGRYLSRELYDAVRRWEALPAPVRGLLTAVCLDRLDDAALAALADWLDEHGTSGGARVRLLRPAPGDVLAVWCDPPLNEPGGLEEQQRVYEEVVRPRELPPVFLSPHEGRIEVMDMRAVHDGWVTEGEAARRVRAEREACARLAAALSGERLAEAIRARGWLT